MNMKKIKYTFLLLVLGIAFAISSCNKYLDVNNNPNTPTDQNITPGPIFTDAEVAYGARLAGQFVFLNNWVGYWAASGDFVPQQDETSYKLTGNTTETQWDNAYGILMDLYLAQTKALATGDSALYGASVVLSVKLWQELVDQFGNVPYSQAFNYAKYPNPAYDNASAIYADLLNKLDIGIKYLNTVNPKSSFATYDWIFARGGSVSTAIGLWKQFANTIKLRIFLRQSEIGFVPSGAQLSKIAADGGFLGAGQDVAVNPGYTNDVNKQNPFYGDFILTPSGAPATSINVPNNYFVNIIEAKIDPRVNLFYLPPISGCDYGAPGGNASGGASIPGSGIGLGPAPSSISDQFILPSFESLFFQAEATVRGWLPGGDAGAQTLYQSAITESFVWLGVPNAVDTAMQYYTNIPSAQWSNSGSTLQQKVDFIAYQKYIANCSIDASETWADFRRLGIFIPNGYQSYNPNAAPTLPNVMVYPQSELSTNSANVPSRNLSTIFTEKIFWEP